MAERTPRSAEMRKSTEYRPESALPEPDQDPLFSYRWVATHVMGTLDASNSSKRFREGWEPVKASDHPELHIPANANGNVELGGLMLCRMPKELAKSRADYYNRQTAAQMESVDNSFMRQSDARMPLFKERKSEVSRGRGFGTGTN